MAVLGEIRKRSWILIAVVALGLLAFLIEPGSLINNLKQINPNNFGEVNGSVITREEYDASLMALNNQNQGRVPQNMLRDRAWEGAVTNKLIAVQAELAGLQINQEVLFAYFPELPTQIEELKTAANSGNQQAREQLAKLPQIIQSQIDNLQNNLYNSLLGTTLLTNKLEVKYAQQSNSEQVAIDYVKVDYEKYNEKHPTEVSDQDLQKYIDAHKNLFKRQASSSFNYVYFPNNPSAKDKALFNKNMNAILNGGVEYDIETGEILDSIQSFRTTKNDSMYVTQYSLEAFNPNYYGVQQISQQFTPEVGNWVKSASVGDIYGPFTKSDYSIISKLSGKKVLDSIQSKHILVAYSGALRQTATRSKEEAQALANQLLTQVKANPASFAQVAMTSSDDQDTAQRGGELGWVMEDNKQMTPEYMEYLTQNTPGSIGVVESPFGFHIIQVEAKKKGTSYQLANVIKESRSSKATEDSIFRKANKYFSEVKSGDLQNFVDIATKNNFTQNDAKDVSRFQGVIQELNTDIDDDIIAWTFNPETKIGESNIFTTANEDYVIVRLTGRTEAGLATPAQIKGEYSTKVRNEKIAKSLQGKFKGKTLDAVATEYGGEKLSDSLSMAQFVLPKSGYEPKVVGISFGLKANQTSDAIGGNSGVFMVQSKGITPKANPMDETTLKSRLDQQNQQQTGLIFESMRREADIKDERAKVFN